MDIWQEKISRTGFLTSSASYALFWVADLLRPGFVARYLSVHVFLLAAMVFGAWWSMTARGHRDRPLFSYTVAVLLGALLAVIAWNAGGAFGSYRILAAVAAAILPAVVVSLARSE